MFVMRKSVTAIALAMNLVVIVLISIGTLASKLMAQTAQNSNPEISRIEALTRMAFT